jgi:ABC-type branched-subunit amino acid transport system substrate-binding protein
VKYLFLAGWATVLSVGCSDTKSDANSDAKNEPRGQISIGVFMPLTSGNLSSQTPGWEGAIKVAMNEINLAGGVLHSDISLIMNDSYDSIQTAPPYSSDQAAQQSLAAGENLWVFSDGGQNPNHMASTAQTGGALVIFTVAGGDNVTTLDTTDMFFRTCSKAADVAQATAHYVYSEGRRNVAVIASPTNLTTTAQPFAAYFRGLQGGIVQFTGASGSVDYFLGPNAVAYSNYDADVQTVLAQSPDAIFVTSTLDPTGAGYLQALLNANYTGEIFVDSMMTDTTLFTKVKGNTNGIRGVLAGNPTARNALAQKVEAASGILLTTTSRLAENYDAIYLMALAIAQAGSIEPLAVRDGLRAVAGPAGTIVGPGDFIRALQLIAAGQPVNYDGISGSLDFDANGNVSSIFDLWVTRDGAFVSTGTWAPTTP